MSTSLYGGAASRTVLDAGVLARDLHEATHVRPRLPGEQRLASGRRTVMDEVVERGVVGQERHCFMDEVQNGDADRLSHRASSGRWRSWWSLPGVARSAQAVEAEGAA